MVNLSINSRQSLIIIGAMLSLALIIAFSPVTTTTSFGQIESSNITNVTKLPPYLQNLTKILQNNYADLITIEHISDKFIVLRFGEIDSDSGWNSVKFVMDHTGLKIKNVLSSGLGSVGNPTRFFVVMTRD
jgi:hypothetical protein